jgi:hypothetical protein
MPKQMRRRAGEFRLSTETRILLPAVEGSLDRSLLVAAQKACDELFDRTGFELALGRSRRSDREVPSIVCRIDHQAPLRPKAATAKDAYRLTIRSKGIEIAASSSNGIRHGLQSLCQLASRRGSFPAIDIIDQPDYPNRGLMLDISRGKVPTRATLEDLVDLCSKLRLNVLMLYIEHTFDFHRHPEIGEGSSPLDAETVLTLEAYAADRGVELVPCLQSLGHMERVLSLERYAHLAESDRRWSLSPSQPGTYSLLEDLYDEFLPLFGSTRFNANCDEPFDLGRGQSATRAPRRSPGELFTQHVGKLGRLSKSHRKQLMIWADFAHQHPDQLDRLSRDVVLLDWWYEAKFDADRIRKLRRKGFDVWVCPGTSSWNCLFPRVENSRRNITRWAEAGRAHGATGLLNTDWGDFGHYNALGVSLHAYAWGAQQAWSGTIEANRFDRAFGRRVFGDDDATMARLYRRLGAVHDAGFHVANGSALQYLYFDGLGRSFFLQHAKHDALERSAKKLDAIRSGIERLGLAESPPDFEGLARCEIAWAADATRLAVEKGLGALEYNAWRATPSNIDAKARRALASRLDRIADDQTEQLDRLERLWLARNAISDFAKVRKRIRKSISNLRTGVRRLRENAPPNRVAERELTLLGVYDEIRREMGMPPRGA